MHLAHLDASKKDSTGQRMPISGSTTLPSLPRPDVDATSATKLSWAPRRPSTGRLQDSDLDDQNATGSTSPPRTAGQTRIAGCASCPELGAKISGAGIFGKRAAPREGKVVLTVGCFDMLHRGHMALFKRLMDASDKLVIGVHDDESIKQMKNITTGDPSTKRFSQIQLALRPQDDSPTRTPTKMRPEAWSVNLSQKIVEAGGTSGPPPWNESQ